MLNYTVKQFYINLRNISFVLPNISRWVQLIGNSSENDMKIINIMRWLKHSLPRKALERLFINRIRPMIYYANVIYDNCPKYLADRLEGVQIMATGICTVVMRQTSSE